MNCKNCNNPLAESSNYCRECGARVIHQRLSVSFLLSEAKENMFSIDANKPLLTFIDLFKRPEEVVGGYLNGVRKKYINPFGYFTLAVTFSGLFYFIVFKFFPEIFDNFFSSYNQNEAQLEFFHTIQRRIVEYQSLFFFAAVPLFAVMSWIVFFNKHKYNYAEHLILNLYCYSQTSIVSVLLYFLTMWNATVFSVVMFGILPLQIIYYSYALKRLYKLTFIQLIIKIIYFVALLIPLYLAVLSIFVIFLYNMGNLDPMLETIRAKHDIGSLN